MFKVCTEVKPFAVGIKDDNSIVEVFEENKIIYFATAFLKIF